MNTISFLKNFLTILFADDTTLGLDDYNYNDLMDKFNTSIMNLIQWCYYNKMDINWKKTEIMFIHNKKNITIPDFIMINEYQVKKMKLQSNAI